MKTALQEIEHLALTIAQEAQRDGIKLDQKLEALKTLAPYYAALKKDARKEPDDDEGSLEQMVAGISETEEGQNGRRVQIGGSRRT